jgi:hypothetical protein
VSVRRDTAPEGHGPLQAARLAENAAGPQALSLPAVSRMLANAGMRGRARAGQARQALHMQRHYGNRAVQRLLAPAAPVLSVQRLVDRKETEREARDVMLAWFDAKEAGKQKYAAISKPYEALLAGLDDYHAFTAKTVVPAFADKGPEVFAKALVERLDALQKLVLNVAMADKGLELKAVVNLVLGSITKERDVVDGIAKTFTTGIPMLVKSGWDSQFANKPVRKAIQIAEFALPMYKGGYSQERAFIRKGGMDRTMPTKGYKLHVSVHEMTQAKARDTLMPFLDKLGYMHKIVADVGDLTGPQVGKVVTIYPKDPNEATKADGFAPLVAAIEKECDAWSLIAGPAVPGETPLGTKGLVYQEKDAKYFG